ncbi:ParM/StbA family protein [Pannus brasiliensis CCIBt3594]|uniref:ParM/StbA family protein n=1 Tax=Pannus brasiliensis CCIBt3594 TaxID=1427578 RepID=A0AAW9QXS2_9CHRO
MRRLAEPTEIGARQSTLTPYTLMADVTIAADFGASLGRALYSVNPPRGKPGLLLLDPQVVLVPAKSIENYEKYKLGESNPEDSAWVRFGDTHYAVGALARKTFHAVHCLDSLKIDSALPQALSIVGSVAIRERLPERFSLSLGILLPWNEFRDREKFESRISTALSDYIFRGRQFHVELETFTALPEGGGLLARGRKPARAGEMLKSAKSVNIAVIMLGYRNSSLLVLEKGELTKGMTGDLGFAKMIDRIQLCTSGQKAEVLVSVICAAGGKPGKKVLQTLARSHRTELREREVEELVEAITDARAEYIALLQNWLVQHLPPNTPIDEFLVSGGTARYLKRELNELLKRFGGSLNWCEGLEERVLEAFGEIARERCLESRLADVYGLFYKLGNRPLPRAPETTGERIDVRPTS